MFGISQLSTRIDRLEERVRQQDAAINRLCDQLGVDPVTVDPVGQVDDTERELIANGKKVEAIKHHRERTGSRLTQAVQAVDAATPKS